MFLAYEMSNMHTHTHTHMHTHTLQVAGLLTNNVLHVPIFGSSRFRILYGLPDPLLSFLMLSSQFLQANSGTLLKRVMIVLFHIASMHRHKNLHIYIRIYIYIYMYMAYGSYIRRKFRKYQKIQIKCFM